VTRAIEPTAIIRRVSAPLDLSIVVPTLNERENVALLIPALQRIVASLSITAEILVIDGGSTDGTGDQASSQGARVIVVPTGGYGEAIRVGLSEAAGAYVVTMDADLSHEPRVVADLWAARGPLTIAIASRYVRGGSAKMSRTRWALSRSLNIVFARGLSLPAKDLSSGFRIYPASAARALRARAADFDVLPELLVRAHCGGWRIVEVPFKYVPRHSGSSKARVFRLGRAYIRTFGHLWRLRNSIEAADYDERAFNSVVPLQRYWQRRRHSIVTRSDTRLGRVLDVGCGSSRILRDLGDVVGVDVAFHKLRYMKRYGPRLVQASVFALPFPDRAFDTVICSEVIEHIESGHTPFHELSRVQRPGGRLVLGTPDYARRSWRMIEAFYRVLAPGGYADEHITQYRHDQLRDLVVALGYRHVRTEYVFQSEMILTFEKQTA
jgi:dolichol-phosphate mannosyltransferase